MTEWELEEMSNLSTLYGSLGSPELQAAFKDWEAQMNELVGYSEVENWVIA